MTDAKYTGLARGSKSIGIPADQVLEHIAPVDLTMHLRSVRGALKNGGIFIVNMPNKLFGPSDVT